ncbi:MAG: hypothetical protein IID45_08770, partial [Planctomycetes bacterium]|nr:hypothetical protein [Planctomycetota bacterium]
FSCVYLLNVPRLEPRAIQRLEEYVRAGGGLTWFVGDSIDDVAYNKDLYRLESSKDNDKGKDKNKGKDGKTPNRVAGLFPVKLAKTHQELELLAPNSREPDMILTGDHPIFRDLASIDAALIGSLKIRRYWPIAAGEFGATANRWEPNDAKRNDGVITIARLRNQQPFLFEHRLGKGRIITWLTTAGAKWADWTALKIYTVFQLELQRYIAVRRPDRQKITGQQLLDEVPAADYKSVASVRSPDAKGRLGVMREVQLVQVKKETPVSPTRSNGSTPKTKTVVYYQLDSNRQKVDVNTNRPGPLLIRYTSQKSTGAPLERMFAFNTPVEESNLTLMPEKEVNRTFANSNGFHFYGFDDDAVFKGKRPGQLARRILLILLVVLLLAEQFLAYRLSYHAEQV